MTSEEQELRLQVAGLSEAEKTDRIVELTARVSELTERVTELTGQVAELTGRVAELEQRLGMNSANSSKPPSSDGYEKPSPKSLREKSGRKPGGQKGHPGSTLRQVCEPDEVVSHEPGHCVCQRGLANQPIHHVEHRQVFELPKKLFWVTEHQVVWKQCPDCGSMVCGKDPAHAPGPAQYGPRFKAMLVYMRDYQHLPYQRLTQFCGDILGMAVSKGTIEAALRRAHEGLSSFEAALRTLLAEADVLHGDETGMRVEGGLRWIHTVCSHDATLYQAHRKRGGEAIEDNGILPAFEGVVVHDCWGPYFKIGARHALCGAHLLRELQAVCENEGHRWAHGMACLLGMIAKTQAAGNGARLSPELADWFEGAYSDILARGEAELPPPVKRPGKRGRPRKSKAANLHARLVTHRDAVLRCLREPGVPFTNNLAERAIRMVKVRQKISGCHRTFAGTQVFARITSYISTSLKQHQNLLHNITNAIAGNPWIPHPRAPNQ